jgi:hypothetical protein
MLTVRCPHTIDNTVALSSAPAARHGANMPAAAGAMVVAARD